VDDRAELIIPAMSSITSSGVIPEHWPRRGRYPRK